MNNLNSFSTQSKDVKVLSDVLSTYGLVKIEDYLSNNEISTLLSEARQAVVTYKNYKNPYGNCARFSYKEIPKELSISRDLIEGDCLNPIPDDFPATKDLFERFFFQHLIKDYIGNGAGYMEAIVFTQDYIPDSKTIYGLLHYDRRHQLKFIFYLTDTNKANGAFGCIPRSHKYGEKLYYKNWAKLLNLDPSQRSEIDRLALSVPENEANYKKIPCVLEHIDFAKEGEPNFERIFVDGKAGTLVIFDTHLLHFGGKVDAGKERWTLKGHTFAYINKK